MCMYAHPLGLLGRLPVATWIHPTTGAPLARSSMPQASYKHAPVRSLFSSNALPSPGVQVGFESVWRLSAGQADVDLVTAIRSTKRLKLGPPRLIFYDCRSQLVAKVTKVGQWVSACLNARGVGLAATSRRSEPAQSIRTHQSRYGAGQGRRARGHRGLWRGGVLQTPVLRHTEHTLGHNLLPLIQILSPRVAPHSCL